MNEYRVKVDRVAAKAIHALGKQTQRRIFKALDDLRFDPYPPGTKSLKGHPGAFRVRVGEYRILYTVEKDLLLVRVFKVGPRQDVYRGF